MYVFAEVLSNIRQANLFISLFSHKTNDTRIEISADRKRVTVLHHAESASVCLPQPVSRDAQVKIPTDAQNDISLRLELAESGPSNPSCQRAALGQEGPWSAQDMSPLAGMRCRECLTKLLPVDHPLVYKDLPSDQWAEMMDLWHCHRPVDHQDVASDDVAKAATSKGYGASNQLVANVGAVFVSHTAFLLAPQNCQNVQISSNEVQCSHCNLVLGVFDTPKNGLWLSKCNLSICPNPETGDWEVHPLEIFISARLLSILDSSGARKVVAHTEEAAAAAQRGLLLWLFNPDIKYSSSRRAEPVVWAMKIFFREIEEPKTMLDEHQASVEDLQLDAKSYKRLKEVLQSSNELLPPTARTFKEWTIGLLDRYEPKDKD